MSKEMLVRYIVCRIAEGLYFLIIDYFGKDDGLELPGAVVFEVSADFNAPEKKGALEFTQELDRRAKAKARELGILFVVGLDD